MKLNGTRFVIPLAAGLLVWLTFVGDIEAGEYLAFPTHQKDIESALSFPSRAGTRGLPDGAETRGIGDVVDDQPLPELKVGAMINFDFDSYTIRPESYPLLDEFGKALTGGLKDAAIVIAGHTDATGPGAYNEELSVLRAASVADYLVSRYGIDRRRLSIQGYGESRPIADNESEGGRFKNRRVEFIRVE
jgi:outer membrane protein OmpA-like peptidoglycan-associated protein